MKHLIFFIFIIILSSCNRNFDKNNLKNYLSTFNKELNDYSKIAIINVDVCSSCDNVVQQFLFANKDNQDLLIVLSSGSRKKIDLIAEQYIGDNLIKDSKQKALFEFNLVVNQPVLFSVNKNKIQKKTLMINELPDIFE